MAKKDGVWTGGASADLGPSPKAVEASARLGDRASGLGLRPEVAATVPPPEPPLAEARSPKPPPPGGPRDPDHTDTYRAALDLATKVFTVVSLAENERYYLRDQLERKSTAVPQLVTKALSAIRDARVNYYRLAKEAARDCLTLLDVLRDRGTVELEAIEPAREACLSIMARLDDLTRLR